MYLLKLRIKWHFLKIFNRKNVRGHADEIQAYILRVDRQHETDCGRRKLINWPLRVDIGNERASTSLRIQLGLINFLRLRKLSDEAVPSTCPSKGSQYHFQQSPISRSFFFLATSRSCWGIWFVRTCLWLWLFGNFFSANFLFKKLNSRISIVYGHEKSLLAMLYTFFGVFTRSDTHSNNGLMRILRVAQFKKQDNSCYVLDGRGIRDDAFGGKAARMRIPRSPLSLSLSLPFYYIFYLLYFRYIEWDNWIW